MTSAADESVTGSSDVPSEVFQVSVEAGRPAPAVRSPLRVTQLYERGHGVACRSPLIGRRGSDVIDDVTEAAGGEVAVNQPTHDVTSGFVLTCPCDVIRCRLRA